MVISLKSDFSAHLGYTVYYIWCQVHNSLLVQKQK